MDIHITKGLVKGVSVHEITRMIQTKPRRIKDMTTWASDLTIVSDDGVYRIKLFADSRDELQIITNKGSHNH